MSYGKMRKFFGSKGRNPPTSTGNAPEALSPESSGSASTASDRRRGSGVAQEPASRLSTREIQTSFGSNIGASSERSRSHSRDPRSDPLGLTVVHEPELSPSLNIVFVHGLGGTSRATWAKGRDPEYFWPQKWLPFEPGIQTARILSFGYNANLNIAGSGPITRISDFAKELLYEMKFAKDENLEELDLGQRPIIFIVHSMGGLVVKQAYILGQNDQQYSDLVSSISAILFLATPHRGSNLADILNRILAVSFNQSSKQYISELKNGSPTIEALNDQFRHIAPRLDIISFYETLHTSVGPKKFMVVGRASATLGYPKEISKSLNADHHTICKFDSNRDSNYVSVRNGLKSLITTIRSTGHHFFGAQEKTEIEQVEALLAPAGNYQDDLDFFRRRWTPGTCEWILANVSFKKWMNESEKDLAVLWLHALPASGKSILSSFIIHYLLEEAFCVYYFFRFGDPSKRSLSTCLRTIAFQISQQLPQFRQALKDFRVSSKTMEKTDAKTLWEKIFLGVLFKMRLTTTMYWIIDAVDESDHSQLLIKLMQGVCNSSVPIKVLLVSRQTPELVSTFDRLSTLVPSASLPLENTKLDIRLYVEKEVHHMRSSTEFKLDIIERLVNGASGNFLWASLALLEVLRCNTQNDIDETLKGIPCGMKEFYQRMENQIIQETRPQDQELGRMILTWAACSRRPLILEELAQALQPEFSVIQDLTFTISRVCAQFAVIDSFNQLIMLHQTARDHIITTESLLAVNIAEGHEKLFIKCLSVLEGKKKRQDPNRHQEFIQYASTSWAYHLNMTSPESDTTLLLLAKFLEGVSVLEWIVSLAHLQKLKVLMYASRSLNSYARRKRVLYAERNPMLHPLKELDLVESWAIDFLKILGKFGPNLTASPTSIYQQIPPFCPKNSMIYRQYERQASLSYPLSVEGIQNDVWDDRLVKLSLGTNSQALAIECSGDRFAVVTAAGAIVVYSATTFEIKQSLLHTERVFAMCFSSSTDLLVSYGFHTTKVWSVYTGEMVRQLQNPKGARAFTIRFSAENSELVTGCNDGLIRVAQLTAADPAWSVVHGNLLKDDTALNRPVHNIPSRIAFNSGVSCVAVAYRGSPLCVWEMDPPALIGRCMRRRDYAGNSWSVVDQVIWHPKSEEVLGLYMGGQVFRWNPYDNTQQELQVEASILSCSPEGKFFVTGDSNGTMKLYDFDHFALIYQLSCESMINDICFSPDSKRLIDLRGQFCNIWEPNALIRVDETGERDSEIEVSSIPTAAVSEAFIEIQNPITAIATQFRGRYQAIGNEGGVVRVVDSVKGDHVAIELWKSPVTLPILQLDWSHDGNYLACADTTRKVVIHKVKRENDMNWTVALVFDVKVERSSEGIDQVMLNSDGKCLLVRSGPSVTVWSLGVSSSSETPGKSIQSPNTKWINHPTNSSLLLAFGPSRIQVYLWEGFSEITAFSIDTPPHLSSPDDNQTSDQIGAPSEDVKINRIFAEPSGSHILIDTILSTKESQIHLTSVIETSSIITTTTSSNTKPPPSSKTPTSSSSPSVPSISPTPLLLPPQIQSQIEIPLGILPRKRLIFLDKDYWMCSWHLSGANHPQNQTETEKIQRHYFLPKDWLDVESLELCTLLADGTFLMPHYGEVAVIKAMGMSN